MRCFLQDSTGTHTHTHTQVRAAFVSILLETRKPSTILSAEAEAEEPAAETDHGPTAKPHLGDQLHVGHQELRRHSTEKGQEDWAGSLSAGHHTPSEDTGAKGIHPFRGHREHRELLTMAQHILCR